MIGEHRTLYRLIVDVPVEHLNRFKSNPLLDLNSLFLVAKVTLVLNLPLQYSSYSVVYDPTVFIACKLIVVAWLIAYAAAMKPRAPVEQLPHGDAARHTLVSRLLTNHLYQIIPRVLLLIRIFFLEIFGCLNGKSIMG